MSARTAISAAALVAAALIPGGAAAGGPSLDASVDRDTVGVGDSFVYTLTVVSEVDIPPSQLKLPDFRGFTHMGQSSSEQISLSFGTGGRGFFRTKGIRVTLAPNRTGTIEIGPASATIQGKRYETQKVTVTVVPAGKAPAQRPQRQQPGGIGRFPNVWDDDFDIDSMFGRPKQVGKDDVFVRAVLDKKTAYVGEQVVYLVQLFSRVAISNPTATLPKFEGFWTEEIVTGQKYVSAEQKVIDGVQYNVYPWRRFALFPTKPGRVAIEPAHVQIPLGGGVFSSGRAINRSTDPIDLDVKPLPAAGRPAAFNDANVGQFTLRTEVSAYATRLDQPITARFIVAGTGNVKYVQLPRIDPGADFKAYDPTVTEKINTTRHRFSGERQWEYLMIPQRVGKAVIPSVTFSFFDPVAGQYHQLETGPIAVEVTPGSGADIARGDLRPKDLKQSGVRPIRYHSALRSDDPDWYRGWPVKLIVAIFPLAYFGVMAYARVTAFVRRETPYARQKRAHAMAFKRLKAAAAILVKGDTDAGLFFAEISRVIREYLAYRIRREVTGLTLEQVGEALREAGVDPALAERTVREVENCDFARFTPTGSRRDEMESALERTRGLLVDLERKG